MIRIIVALAAFGLLLYPLVSLLSPEDYRGTLEDLHGAAEASTAQLQMAAAIHWLKNAYLAFAFLLLARYLGKPVEGGEEITSRSRPEDVRRAGFLLTGFPPVEILYQVLAQMAMNQDPEKLHLNIELSNDFAIYLVLGLCLVGIARTLKGDRP